MNNRKYTVFYKKINTKEIIAFEVDKATLNAIIVFE